MRIEAIGALNEGPCMLPADCFTTNHQVVNPALFQPVLVLMYT